MRKFLPLLLALVPAVASAQPAPKSPVHPPPPIVAAPGPPAESDPMLTPISPARRTVATWEDALDLLRARSTDLRIAAEEVRRAEGQVRFALGAELPAISATATYDHQVSVSPQVVGGLVVSQPDSFTAVLQLVQPVIDFHGWHVVGTAQVSAEASRLSLADAKRDLTRSAAVAIVGVVTAERIAELNRVALRQSLDLFQLTERKAQLGGGNALDVARARHDVETVRAALVTGDESVRQAREALGLTLGVPGQVGVPPDIKMDGLDRSCPAIPSIESRADIAAQGKRAEAAESAVTDVYEQFLPTLSAQSILATVLPATPSIPNTLWDIEAVLTVPIWDGGSRYGSLEQARAVREEARQSLEALHRQATVEFEQASRAVTVAETQRGIASNARAAAAETERLTRLAYQSGQGTSLDLVLAAAQLRASEVNLAGQDFALVRARIVALLARAACRW